MPVVALKNATAAYAFFALFAEILNLLFWVQLAENWLSSKNFIPCLSPKGSQLSRSISHLKSLFFTKLYSLSMDSYFFHSFHLPPTSPFRLCFFQLFRNVRRSLTEKKFVLFGDFQLCHALHFLFFLNPLQWRLCSCRRRSSRFSCYFLFE